MKGRVYRSDVFVFEDLPVCHAGSLDFREVLKGRTVDNCGFAVHESWLPGHSAPRPPPRYTGEEMFFMIDGALEVTINGTPSRITRGSVAFIGSGDLHGVRKTPTKLRPSISWSNSDRRSNLRRCAGSPISFSMNAWHKGKK